MWPASQLGDDDAACVTADVRQMFDTVQRVTFAVRQDLISSIAEDIVPAFRTLLAAIPVLQRMALAPETAIRFFLEIFTG
jgi:hypothetical protein